MADQAAITDLECCPNCSAPSRRLDVAVQELPASMLVEVSCRRCGFETCQLIRFPSHKDIQEMESAVPAWAC